MLNSFYENMKKKWNERITWVINRMYAMVLLCILLKLLVVW